MNAVRRSYFGKKNVGHVIELIDNSGQTYIMRCHMGHNLVCSFLLFSNADPKAKPSAAMGDDNAADTPLQQSVAMAIAGTSVFASSDSRVESTQVQV